MKVNGTSVDDWLVDASTEFPDAEFRLLAGQPRGDGLREIAEITTPNGDTLVRRFTDAPEIRSSEVVHIDEQMLLIKYRLPVSESYEALLTSGNLPRYPVFLQDGWFSFEVISSQEQLSEYTDELAAAGISYELVSLTQSHDSNGLLTERQWEFITEAVERGYFDTPRDCTLAELAETLDINRSAASKLHHRAESRIIKEFVAEAAP